MKFAIGTSGSVWCSQVESFTPNFDLNCFAIFFPDAVTGRSKYVEAFFERYLKFKIERNLSYEACLLI